MKAQNLRVWTLSMATSSLVMCAGCEEDKVRAETQSVTNAPVANLAVGPSFPVVSLTNPAVTPGLTQASLATGSAPPPTSLLGQSDPTNSIPAEPGARVVQAPVIPESLKLSPALAEIVKLVQAGVSEDVMLAFIINSTNVYQLGSDQIVYLNDLGVSPSVVTALIEKDNSPEAQEQKRLATSAAPLPPGVALNTPATNVYPATAPPLLDTVPPETTTTVPATEEPLPPPTYVSAPPAAEQPVNVSYFYSSLAPYGNWIDVDGYGRCWQPTVAVTNPYWRPYADNGRWLWSDSGWYWYSDYSWGWAPFHYGRWCSYPRLGWIWTPDTVWGPSWVTWRYTPYYCGWAPLPPSCQYVSGFGLYYQNSSVGFGFGFGLGASCYTFLPVNRFCDSRPYHYYVPSGQAHAIYKDSTIVNNYISGNNNTIINEGIGREKIARVTRGEIQKVAIRDAPLTSGSTRPERLERNGDSMVVVRPKLPPAPVARGGEAGTAPKSLQAPDPGLAEKSAKRPPSRPEQRPEVSTLTASPAQSSSTKKPAEPIRVFTTSPRPSTITQAENADPGSGQSSTGTKSGSVPLSRRPVAGSARTSSFSDKTATASPSGTIASQTAESTSRPASRSSVAAQTSPESAGAASRGAQTLPPARQPSVLQSRPSPTTGYPGANVGSSARVVPGQSAPSSAVISRPTPKSTASSPITRSPVVFSAPTTASRPEASRSYGAPARVVAPPTQIVQPQQSRPSPLVSVPAARPSFSPPSSLSIPATRPSPTFRSEPIRPQVPAPSRVYSAPAQSAPAARPQSPPPSSSGGGRRDDGGAARR